MLGKLLRRIQTKAEPGGLEMNFDFDKKIMFFWRMLTFFLLLKFVDQLSGNYL